MSKTDELQLCNCDGFWHVECPDGITRYVSEESLASYLAKQEAALLERLSAEGRCGCHVCDFIGDELARLKAGRKG